MYRGRTDAHDITKYFTRPEQGQAVVYLVVVQFEMHTSAAIRQISQNIFVDGAQNGQCKLTLGMLARFSCLAGFLLHGPDYRPFAKSGQYGL